MNNATNIRVDTLSYKQLQGLAMSLKLPGKMKQGVLVEAIKARQSQNEHVVTMILEANRQRRFVMRQRQQQQQQQQLMKIDKEEDNNSKCMTRSRIKRSASEMEMEAFIDDEGFKRSKLATALIQQRRPSFFSSITTGTTSIRKEQQQYQQPSLSAAGCSTWDQQHPIIEPIVPLPSQSLPIIQKPLPDLSKELSILPTLSDCSTTPSTNDQDLGCCSVGSVSSGANSNWSSMSSNPDQQPFSQSNFEGCDPAGWIGSENSYDLNTWKTLPNIKMGNGFDNVATSSSSNTSGFFEDNPSADVFINSGDIYRAEDFVTNPTITSITSTSSAINSNYADYQLAQSLDSTFQQDIKSESWCESFTPLQFQSSQQQQQNQQVMHNNESRFLNDCCNNFDCYQQGGPHFRLQRPGNPTALFVPSGRSLTLPTFCNMLPRVVSYVQ